MTKINVKGPIVSNDIAWIYRYFGMDAACPNDINNGLNESGGDDVVIEINSPGGICVYGYEMYKAIKDYSGKVTVHVISAMSAATLVACAADETLMSDAAIFMIHNARSEASGDYRDMHMTGQALEEVNAGIINVYMKKTCMSREEIQDLMDKDTYMSPAKAIELGFADGYIYGEPDNGTGDNITDLITGIVATGTQIIPEDKAREMIMLIKANEAQNGGSADADISSILNEGGNKMTLSEFLTQNPEAQGEIDTIRAQAQADGRNAERERIRSIDAIAGTVKAEALFEAKYGEKPVDGPTLAYQAMVNGEKLAVAYMGDAKADSDESGVNNVGIGKPDEETDEADTMAAYINKTRGGK